MMTINDDWKQRLEMLARAGIMPSYIAGDFLSRMEVFREIDRLYDYPPDLKAFMQEQYANGIKKVWVMDTEPGVVVVRFESLTLKAIYKPRPGATPQEEAQIRSGVLKWLIIRAWNKKTGQAE